MNVRSLGLALLLATMTFACQQKLAPTDEPAEDEKTAQDATTTPPAGEAAKKDAPVKTDDAAKADAPAPPPKADAPAPKTDAPAKTDDAKKDAPANPLETPDCLAKCTDPSCISKCFGGGDDPFGF